MLRREANVKVIVVAASSKKAGKSMLAAYLVRELGAKQALKVSAGGIHPGKEAIVTDARELSRAGTDTGALLAAGATSVAWVNTSSEELGSALAKALTSFPKDGILIVEGNSALQHLVPDFTVFLMAVPLEGFKPSASAALERADLVLVDRSGPLGEVDLGELKKEIRARAPRAEHIFYRAPRDYDLTFKEAAIEARLALGLGPAEKQ